MERLEGITLIIFDFDGTLGVIDARWDAVRSEIQSFLEENGISFSGKGIHKMIELIEDEKIRKDAFEIIRRHELDAVERSHIFDKAKAVIIQMHHLGYKLAIVTRNTEDAVSQIVDKEGLDTCFECIDGFDIDKKVKPEPDQILAVMDGRDADSCIMIGDGIYDIAAAKGAGIKGVGVCGGINTDEELKVAGAYCVLSDISELMDVLKS